MIEIYLIIKNDNTCIYDDKKVYKTNQTDNSIPCVFSVS